MANLQPPKRSCVAGEARRHRCSELGCLDFPITPHPGHLSLLPSPPFTCPPEARALFLPKTKPHIPRHYHPDFTLPGFLTLAVLISYLLLLVEPPGLKGKTGASREG